MTVGAPPSSPIDRLGAAAPGGAHGGAGGRERAPVTRRWRRLFGARGFSQTSKTSESAQRSSLAAPTAGPVRAVRCGSRDVSSPSRPLPLGAVEPPPGLRVARRLGVMPRDRGRSPVRPSQHSTRAKRRAPPPRARELDGDGFAQNYFDFEFFFAPPFIELPPSVRNCSSSTL